MQYDSLLKKAYNVPWIIQIGNFMRVGIGEYETMSLSCIC